MQKSMVESPVRFLAIEKDLGNNTSLLFSQKITKEDYEYYKLNYGEVQCWKNGTNGTTQEIIG